MFRPILLLLPCIVLSMTMAIDSEEKLEMLNDIDETEDEMDLDRDLNTEDDFEEEDDDLLSEEEVEDRATILSDRLGRPSGPIVECGRWTNRVVNITNLMHNETTASMFETSKITSRCTVVFKPVDCDEIQLICTKFLVDNRDPVACKRGDTFMTKPSERINSTTVEQPQKWCKKEGPTANFPVLSPYGPLKIWYKKGDFKLGAGRYPAQGVRCLATCSKPL